MTDSTSPKIIDYFVELATKDFSPKCKPQFARYADSEFYKPTPNKPKTPDELMNEAIQNKKKV